LAPVARVVVVRGVAPTPVRGRWLLLVAVLRALSVELALGLRQQLFEFSPVERNAAAFRAHIDGHALPVALVQHTDFASWAVHPALLGRRFGGRNPPGQTLFSGQVRWPFGVGLSWHAGSTRRI